MEVDEVTLVYLKHEKELNIKIINVARQIEEGWRIKSRKMWLKSGDNNTEYYHKQTNVQQSYNPIKEMKDNQGNRITGQEDLKDHTFSHFQELYVDTGETDPEAQMDLLHGIPSLISDAENRELENPTTEYEIISAI